MKIETGEVLASEIKCDETRRIGVDAAIKALLSGGWEAGLVRPIILDRHKNVIHGSAEFIAAKMLEYKKVRCVTLDLFSILGGNSEHAVRRTFTVEERLAIAAAIENVIGRRNIGRPKKKSPKSSIANKFKGKRTDDLAGYAAALGGHTNYRKIKKIFSTGTDEERNAIKEKDKSTLESEIWFLENSVDESYPIGLNPGNALLYNKRQGDAP